MKLRDELKYLFALSIVIPAGKNKFLIYND